MILRAWACFLALSIAGSAFALDDGADAQKSAEVDTSARDAMAKVLRHYQNCVAYRDEGFVRNIFRTGGPPPDGLENLVDFKFSTCYRKGELFLFKSAPPSPYTIQLRDGRLHLEAFGQWLIENKKVEDFSAALRKMANTISAETEGASTCVPLLLLGEGRFVASLKNPLKWSQLADASVRRILCKRYELQDGFLVWEFFIDDKTKRIVQISRKKRYGKSRIDIIYEAEVSEGKVHKEEE